jgi:Domain of unknown function (DUF4160)
LPNAVTPLNTSRDQPAFHIACTYQKRYCRKEVGRKKRRGYIFETYSGDHRPYHVHIYRGAEFIGRFDIENQIAMDGDLSSQVLKYLEELGYKKSSKG